MVTTQLLSKDYFSTGDEVGGYTLLEIIGGGGEGAVWSAWDPKNERIVAIKFFKLDQTAIDFDKRKQDLQNLADLKHSNVREVFEVGSGTGFVFFVMRYFPYGSLSDLIVKNELTTDQILSIAAQVTASLSYIHSKKVVHRDLKPSNVLLDHQHRAYLTDFGIARTLSGSTLAMHTGQGTPAYSSPEQHTRAYIDHLTDIYSFGIMLFEMLAGDLPFQGLSALAIQQIDRKVEIPDPRELKSNLPPDLHMALKQITHYDPDQRPKRIEDAFELVLDVFNRTGFATPGPSYEAVLRQTTPLEYGSQWQLKEAQFLLKHNLDKWEKEEGRHRMRLTGFVFLHQVFSDQRHFILLNKKQIIFLAYTAILHGQNLSYWWSKVEDPADRLMISEMLFGNEVGDPILNVMKLLMLEPYQFSGISAYSDKLVPPLLEQIQIDGLPEVKNKALILLDALMEPANDWQDAAISEEMDQQLAELSLSTDLYSIRAARMIGKLKSEAAVRWIVEETQGSESDAALLSLATIRETAGSLPKSVGFSAQARAWLNIAVKQLIANRREVIQLYLLAAMAVGLGLSVHVFWSQRLPGYLDPSRVLNSFGSGILFGPIIAIGIFINRWIINRLEIIKMLPRVTLGILLGTLLVNLGFVAFHFFFLSNPPVGYLILLGSLLLSIGFGIGDALKLSRVMKMAISAISVGIAVWSTFEVARLNWMSPMLYYEYTQPVRAGVLMVGFSVIVGIVSQLNREHGRNDLLAL